MKGKFTRMDTIPQDSIPRKHCPRCQEWKPATLDFFARNRNRRDGLQVYCKVCLRRNPDPFAYEELPEGQKRCSDCKQVLPATPAYFNRHHSQKDGLCSQCKKCIGKGTTFGKVKENKPNEKQCSTCWQWFPLDTDHFQRNKGHRDGFTSQCKECISKSKKARHAALSEAEREEYKQQQRQYYETHQADVCRVNREYYARHKAEVYRYKRRFREEHYEQLHQPEVIRQRRLYLQGWRNRPDGLERRREVDRVHAHKRRARKKSVPGEHTPEQIRAQYKRQKGKCYYCHKRVKWGEHEIEHTYPLSRVEGTDIPANSIDYLVIACKPCNGKKYNKFPWEFPEGGRLM